MCLGPPACTYSGALDNSLQSGLQVVMYTRPDCVTASARATGLADMFDQLVGTNQKIDFPPIIISLKFRKTNLLQDHDTACVCTGRVPSSSEDRGCVCRRRRQLSLHAAVLCSGKYLVKTYTSADSGGGRAEAQTYLPRSMSEAVCRCLRSRMCSVFPTSSLKKKWIKNVWRVVAGNRTRCGRCCR